MPQKNYNTAESIYGDISNLPHLFTPPKEIETLVIGGGLLGLSTALSLAEKGHEVLVVEAKKIGSSPSGRSGGQLWPGYDGSLSKMRKEFGDELTLSAWKLTDEALQEVHRRLSLRYDKCNFAPGLLLASKTKLQAKWVNDEFEHYKELKLEFASLLSRDEIKRQYVNTENYLNGILFRGEEGKQYGHLNPRKYIETVATLAVENGVKLSEDTLVNEVRRNQNNDEYLIKTSQGEVIARNVVFATGVNFFRPKGISLDIIPRVFIPVQTVILATESISKDLAFEMVPGNVCFCDASDIAMNYAALIPDSQKPGNYHLTFGGADALMQAELETEVPRLEKEMRDMFPQLDRDAIKVEKIWGGKCDLSRNALPFISNPQKGIFYAGGFSGQGMVNTTLYGRAIAEKILGGGTTFELLKQLNPKPYSKVAILAWLEALKRTISNNL